MSFRLVCTSINIKHDAFYFFQMHTPAVRSNSSATAVWRVGWRFMRDLGLSPRVDENVKQNLEGQVGFYVTARSRWWNMIKVDNGWALETQSSHYPTRYITSMYIFICGWKHINKPCELGNRDVNVLWNIGAILLAELHTKWCWDIPKICATHKNRTVKWSIISNLAMTRDPTRVHSFKI